MDLLVDKFSHGYVHSWMGKSIYGSIHLCMDRFIHDIIHSWICGSFMDRIIDSFKELFTPYCFYIIYGSLIVSISVVKLCVKDSIWFHPPVDQSENSEELRTR